jgi:uncharacterized protein (TIGR03435 family)
VTRHLHRQFRAGIIRAIVAVAAVILPALAIGTPIVPVARAQTQTAAPHSFATISIRPTPANEHLSGFSASAVGRFTATATSVQDLIFYAYDERTIAGGPEWMSTAHFDIDARVDDSLATSWKMLPPTQRDELVRAMIRSMLEDRFKLAVRRETQDVPIYALVVAKGGPKLSPSPITLPGSKPVGQTQRGGPALTPGFHTLTVKNVTMISLSDQLADQPDVDRMVVDRTGLTGIYDFTLTWSDSKDDSGPTLFQALEDQLGLKLEPTKGPVEVLIIDHLERPSEN